MQKIEKAIQKALIHWVHETYPDVIITATANELNYRETDQIGSLGITDLILFSIDERVLFLELKRKSGSLLPSQIEWNRLFDLRVRSRFSRNIAYGFQMAQRLITLWMTVDVTV